ncbi:DNA-binding NarL/FixJ family response regulator [Granulicella aggregans]|uniref:DNA-binding NarL/FixJ family response regulator n=1 Tax=Granulicella aggregans TaxID=474949 RepID=A0A7W7ZDT7_9BACT|nr:response regulator transcription factor [Granulicella aggregans]MBB5058050.1 DNA-binding NarL/FixJ family response regulator [Granulicella aggregans]
MIRVLVVDDHPMMRAGIALEINSETDMTVVGEAIDGHQALVQYRLHTPDVMLVDMRMPNMGGLGTIQNIRAEFPGARIVVLTSAMEDFHAMRAFRAGASGYLSKDMLGSELVKTIRLVSKGQRCIPEGIAAKLLSPDGGPQLSPKELEVLRRAARGLSNKLIAEEMNISEHTVKGYLKSIMAKLDANDRTHAVTIALQRGFFEIG